MTSKIGGLRSGLVLYERRVLSEPEPLLSAVVVGVVDGVVAEVAVDVPLASPVESEPQPAGRRARRGA